MTRISKQGKRRKLYPRKRISSLTQKTGKKKDNLEKGYKEHSNTLNNHLTFIPKIK